MPAEGAVALQGTTMRRVCGVLGTSFGWAGASECTGILHWHFVSTYYF